MTEFVHREGGELYEGKEPFRFLGLASPNLHQNEGQLLSNSSNRWPDEYETRDVLASFQQMGVRATRCFGLSIYFAEDHLPAHLEGPGKYNEEAFRALDRVLSLCHEYDVRVIIPLIDSHSFVAVRGIDEFSAFRGKPGSKFWTDDELRSDFKQLIKWLLNRRNTVSGMLYKDDPAILAWQFGNELSSYASDRKQDAAAFTPILTAWSKEMAAYIKSIDSHHLVMEAGGDRGAFLADPNIDIISEHLYEYWAQWNPKWVGLVGTAIQVEREVGGKKALILDEFGMSSRETTIQLMLELPSHKIAGALLWGIRGHRRDGGFYYHNESGTRFSSYHWPGFSVGEDYDERVLLGVLRQQAYALRGLKSPALAGPTPAPIMFPIESWKRLMWRGSTGASGYILERASDPDGPWATVYDRLEDAVVSNVKALEDSRAVESPALASDPAARLPGKYFYRVKAYNAAGESAFSNVESYTTK